jgi:acetyltransferase-like isoleucine patch superfamily enzyme
MPGGRSVRPWLHRLRGVHLGRDVWISQHVYIDAIHPEAVTIGDRSTIGIRTTILTHLYWGGVKAPELAGPVVIGEDVFVGPHCVILPNVRIGDRSVIRAGSVVSRNVPPNSLFGSQSETVLAEVTVPLTSEHTYAGFVRGLRPIRRA